MERVEIKITKEDASIEVIELTKEQWDRVLLDHVSMEKQREKQRSYHKKHYQETKEERKAKRQMVAKVEKPERSPRGPNKNRAPKVEALWQLAHSAVGVCSEQISA